MRNSAYPQCGIAGAGLTEPRPGIRRDPNEGQGPGDAQSALPVLPMVPLQDTNQTRRPMNLVFPGQGDGQGVVIPLDPSLHGGAPEDGSPGPPIPPPPPPNMSGELTDQKGRSGDSPSEEQRGDGPEGAAGSPSNLGSAQGPEEQASHSGNPSPPLSPLPEWVRARAARGRLPSTPPLEFSPSSNSSHDGPPPPVLGTSMAPASGPAAVTLQLGSDGSLREVATPLSPGAGPESESGPRAVPPPAAPESEASNAFASPPTSEVSQHLSVVPPNSEQAGLRTEEPTPNPPTPSPTGTRQELDIVAAHDVSGGGAAIAASPLVPSPLYPESDSPPTELTRDSTSGQQSAGSAPVPATSPLSADERASAAPQTGAPEYLNPYGGAPSLSPEPSAETAPVVPPAAAAPATEARSNGEQSPGPANSSPSMKPPSAAPPELEGSDRNVAPAWLPGRAPGEAPGPLDQFSSEVANPVGAPAPGTGPFPVEARMAGGEHAREYGFGHVSAEANAPAPLAGQGDRVLRPNLASTGSASQAAQAPGPLPQIVLPWGIANPAPAPGPQPLRPRHPVPHPAMGPAPDLPPLPGPGLPPLPGLVPNTRDFIGPRVSVDSRDRSVLPEGGGAVRSDLTRGSGVSSGSPTLHQGLTVESVGAPVAGANHNSSTAGAILLFSASGSFRR